MEKYFRVGVIANTHGVHGEVKVYPATEDIRRFDGLKEVILDNQKEKKTLHITGVKYFKNMVILKFQEIADMDQALLLKGKDLLVDRDHAIPLEEGEYYIADILGSTVLTDTGETLGILTDVIQTGANDVYVVKTSNGKEVLLPVIDECVLDRNIEKKLVTVHMMKGLLD